ncbi:MAG: MbnP family protein [Chitinophagales bacterium]
MKNNNVLLLAILSILCLFSCKKNEDNNVVPIVETGAVKIQFDNRIGSNGLYLNTLWYTNANGDSMKFTTVKYFVSNFAFTRDDDSVFIVPKDSCYFLVSEADDSTQKVIIRNVPFGKYKKVAFVIGVDSAKSCSPISERTGSLSTSGGMVAGMYWQWNSGYIFVKVEGVSPQSTNIDKSFKYHIGLFGGYLTPTINNLKNVLLDVPAGGTINVLNTNTVPTVHMNVDILQVFNGDTNININEHSEIMVSTLSAFVANNYKNMFVIDHVHNN